MVNWFARKTLGFRHCIVRLIAPKLHLEGSRVTRPMIQFLHQHYGKRLLVGAEIGVAEGRNTKRILDSLNIRKLFLVDPYVALDHVNDFPVASKRLKKYAQVVFVKESSDDAVVMIPDGLDFVYIDGDHSYGQVKRDIEAYYGKVKVEGVLGGHDFDINHLDDVVKAVKEFTAKNGFRLYRASADWWVIKS